MKSVADLRARIEVYFREKDDGLNQLIMARHSLQEAYEHLMTEDECIASHIYDMTLELNTQIAEKLGRIFMKDVLQSPDKTERDQ